MDCPRCGGTLTAYKLGDAETVACDDCVYVGVPVDHTSATERPESWTEALERFYEQHRAEDVPLSDAVVPVFEDADGSASTDAVVPRFERATGEAPPGGGGTKESDTRRTDQRD